MCTKFFFIDLCQQSTLILNKESHSQSNSTHRWCNFQCHLNLTWHKSLQVHFKSCDFPNYIWSTTKTINSVQERKSERDRAEILPNWPQFVTPPSRSCALSRDRSVLKSLRKPIPRLWLSPRLWPNVSQTVQNMQLRSMIVWSLASFAAPCVWDFGIFLPDSFG